MKNLGMLLLSIWLIAKGLIPLLGLSFPGSNILLALLAIAAGILLLLERRQLKLSENLGRLLLAIWLIATGLLPLLNVKFPAADTVLALLAVAAGVLFLLKR